MSDTPDLNLYYLIHRAMRQTADQFASAIAGLEHGDRARATELGWWWNGFSAELHNHHTIEDEIFFPALAARVPAFSTHEAGLADDHARLDELMSGIDEVMPRLLQGAWVAPHKTAVELSAELARFLREHLTVEDEDVLPLFTRHFGADEYEVLDERALKHAPMKQMLFNVPWAVSTLTIDERTEVLATLPKPISIIWGLTRRRYTRRTLAAFGLADLAVAR
jgi:iron-sulfur cluster repair protein YtfE (RIC family)